MVGIGHTALLFGFIAVGVVILVLLVRPTVRSGARLLRNWGVPAPTAEQADVGRRYLLHRRVLYVLLFLVVAAPLSGVTVLAVGRLFFPYLGWFLAALLLGELIAMLRPVRGPVRVASLERRGVLDLLPRWMIGVHLGTVLAAVAATVVLVVNNRTQPGDGPLWTQLLVILGSAIAVHVVGWLAVARPAVGDPQVDRALRLRTARVMIGIGTTFAATVLAGALSLIGTWLGSDAVVVLAFVVQLLGLILWAVMASVFAFWTGFRGQVPAGNG